LDLRASSSWRCFCRHAEAPPAAVSVRGKGVLMPAACREVVAKHSGPRRRVGRRPRWARCARPHLCFVVQRRHRLLQHLARVRQLLELQAGRGGTPEGRRPGGRAAIHQLPRALLPAAASPRLPAGGRGAAPRRRPPGSPAGCPSGTRSTSSSPCPPRAAASGP
jgi:hypothetical protein